MNQSQHYDGLIKVVIVGNCNVGKSCILMRYSEDIFTTQYYNTIGVDFKTSMAKIGEQQIKLQIWDTAGQERFKALTNNYYRDAHGILIVYDVTEKSTFDAVDQWMEDIDKHNYYYWYANKNVCKLLVGNKADMINQRKVSTLDGQEKAKQYKAKFIETSAKTASNVQLLFKTICLQVLELKKQMMTTTKTNPIAQPQVQPNKPCC